jgi:hypothetical protein
MKTLALISVLGAAATSPIVLQLGVHRFGHETSGAVAAHAAPGQVGWQYPNGDISGFGPQTFLVGRDRSIWLDDGLNNRLLVWNPGKAAAVAQTVPLKFSNADSEVALGPAGSIYTTRTLGTGAQHNYRLVLDRQSTSGKLLWETRLPNIGSEFCGRLVVGPGRTLYCVGPHDTWISVATPAGGPIPASKRRRFIGEPVAGGLRLVTSVFPNHSVRFALVDRRGSALRSWRVDSRSPIAGARVLDVIGREPVVVLDIQNVEHRPALWDYVVLRLGPHGVVGRATIRHAVYGDNLLPDLRLGPDGRVYQLRSDPSKGVTIERFALG